MILTAQYCCWIWFFLPNTVVEYDFNYPILLLNMILTAQYCCWIWPNKSAQGSALVPLCVASASANGWYGGSFDSDLQWSAHFDSRQQLLPRQPKTPLTPSVYLITPGLHSPPIPSKDDLYWHGIPPAACRMLLCMIVILLINLTDVGRNSYEAGAGISKGGYY